MQFINYFFGSLISFLGLLIGIFLIRIAPEEQLPLKKYFVKLRKLLLLLIFVFLVFYFFNNPLYLSVLIFYFLFIIFIEYKISDLLRKSMIIYIIMGIFFYLSSNNTNLFAIESSLILLYGIPAASLIYSKKEKNISKIIFYNIGFIVISNLLFFV